MTAPTQKAAQRKGEARGRRRATHAMGPPERSSPSSQVPSAPRDIISAMVSPSWWGDWFADGDWTAWRVFLRALFGLPVDAADLPLLRECTGLAEAPTERAREGFAVVGRRGGKTRIMALIAAYLAVFEDWRPFLAPGERAHILLVSKDKEQAAIALGYLQSLFLDHPVLKGLVKNEVSDEIELRNRVVIRVAAASFRGLRGFAIGALLADEMAFWLGGETANPAEEILRAVRPAMLQFQGRAMLLAASSPYRRAGPLWDAHRRHFGRAGSTLVWVAPTEVMHPMGCAEKDFIAAERAKDPQAAAAEYDVQWRDDLQNFVDPEIVERAVTVGAAEFPPISRATYYGALDPSGAGADPYALAIAHSDAAGHAVLDLVRQWTPPFSPAAVVNEGASIFHQYGISEILTDHWGGEFAREPLRLRGINAVVSTATKSDVFLAVLAPLRSGQVSLLDDRRLLFQLESLERRTSRDGKDVIGHPRGQHDDLINAAALALTAALRDRAPALVHRRDFLGADGAPVAVPCGLCTIFAVLIVGDDGMAATIFASYYERADEVGWPPVIIADIDMAPFAGDTIDRMYQHLEDLHREFRAKMSFTYVQPEIVPQVHLRGFATEPIFRALLRDPRALGLSVAAHVQAGRVKIAAAANAKMMALPLGASLTFRAADQIDRDPLRYAIAIGIALALNPNDTAFLPAPFALLQARQPRWLA